MRVIRLRVIIAATAFLCTLTAVALPTEVPFEDLRPTTQQIQSMLLIHNVMENYHYLKRELDNEFSQEIFTKYLELLDPAKSFFTATDVEEFSRKYATHMDDDIKLGRLKPAFEIFKRFRQRVNGRLDYTLERLEQPFDFSLDEKYRVDREGAPWEPGQAALNESWRKRIKNDFLILKLAHKTDEQIRKQLKKRYESIDRRTRQMDSDDIFLTFMSAYTGALEPHTGYMLPRAAENFDINMRLSLQGIGAVLSSDHEYTKVQKVVLGGPAEQSGQLHAGDSIIAVGQGKNGEMVDVIGWRLRDVVELIRGKKGSTVRLTILPKSSGNSGIEKNILLVRDEIKLEDLAASSKLIETKGRKIGVIKLPTFYRDFSGASQGDTNFRSTTRDVRELLGELQQKGIDGVVIDLRNNGGGALTEATELTGLFIESGPVVQIKDYSGRVEKETDPDPNLVYAGPLAVLVNRNSASASEIFAGAIQDYGRGIVIGEPTFGKGTVQQLVDLSNFVTGKRDLGRVRVTIAQFFRVNGGSTQHRGVIPDIKFPIAVEVDYGERQLDNALPWSSIKATHHDRWTVGNLNKVRGASARRTAESNGFRYLQEEAELLHEIENEQFVSLNEQQRRREWDARESRQLHLHNKYRLSLGLNPLSKAEAAEDDEQALEARHKEEVLDQIEAKEAAAILADIVDQKLMPNIRSVQVLEEPKQPFILGF